MTELGFVHQFIPGSSERTLLMLHGTGGDEQQLIPLAREFDPAAAILSPRGKISENGNARFFRRLAEGVFDLEDLQVQTDALADFVRQAATRYRFDRTKTVAVGYSNGAPEAAPYRIHDNAAEWVRGRQRCGSASRCEKLVYFARTSILASSERTVGTTKL